MIRRFVEFLRRNEKGAALVELAIVCPVFTIIAVGVADFALLMYAQMEVDAAADAGARYATLGFPWNSTNVANAVTSATKASSGSTSSITATPAPTNFCGCATASSITAVTCTSTCSSGLAPGSYVSVNAQWNYSLIMPWPGFTSPRTLSASSTVRIQ
jgi:Flp pilus assembly protein TadG